MKTNTPAKNTQQDTKQSPVTGKPARQTPRAFRDSQTSSERLHREARLTMRNGPLRKRRTFLMRWRRHCRTTYILKTPSWTEILAVREQSNILPKNRPERTSWHFCCLLGSEGFLLQDPNLCPFIPILWMLTIPSLPPRLPYSISTEV